MVQYASGFYQNSPNSRKLGVHVRFANLGHGESIPLRQNRNSVIKNSLMQILYMYHVYWYIRWVMICSRIMWAVL